MGTLQRIKQFIDLKGITVKTFEQKIGFSNGAFGSQLRNNKTIGVDKLENILFEYPELSAEWLLTGKGEMIKSYTDDENIIKEDASGYSMANTLLEQLSKLTETVLSQQKTIESLIETNKKAVVHLGDNATNADAKGA